MHRGDAQNAYVFGKRHPLATYARLGDHSNDGGQTGFIDLDLFDSAVQKSATAKVLDIYIGSHRCIKWDNRVALRKVRQLIPHMLFLGATDGGDMGAGLYAHKTRGQIDGLIVDNHYYFA